MTTVGETSEQRLIRLCRKGDRSAQKALYDRLAPKMFPVCIRYVGDRDAAEDLLQDGFVTLFSRLDSYKGDGSFEGWARKVFDLLVCPGFFKPTTAIPTRLLHHGDVTPS